MKELEFNIENYSAPVLFIVVDRSGRKYFYEHIDFDDEDATVLIHRYVYALRCGEIPSGLSVLHSCDNPLCINPKHLWLGTLEDNNNDRVAKGRTKSKLKVWDVMEIRHLYDLGHRQKDIAKLYNTTQTNISMIITRNTWSHI